jgi:hypothetical protein
MWIPTPRILVILTAALALFMAGLVLATYAGSWPPHSDEPTVFGSPF